ncbi:MAG TPA: DUF4157 domain-containing protein [Kofleriaceae bacterium]|nr:DUF4157 domain-containing protein [Kofleriaceae bacterium]
MPGGAGTPGAFDRSEATPGKRTLTGMGAAPAAVASGLPVAMLAKMERAFGADLGDVRFHTASPEAAALSAQALARGRDVHIAPGSWDPDSATGQELIGHELAHVVQQAQGRVDATEQYKGIATNRDGALEDEADRWGAAAARGEVAVDSGVSAASASAGAAQLKIGFEMQSTWCIRRIGENKAPDSKDIAYRGVYFQIEVDRGKQPELEIVTDPLPDRDAFEGAMREIKYVVAMLTEQQGRRFVVPAGNGWLENTEIERTGTTPTFRLQYTEGVTVDKIPALIQQLHPHAWRDLSDELTGEDEEKRKQDEPEERRGRKRSARAPEAPKLQGLVAAICMYLGDVAKWKPQRASDTEKYAHTLMARTDFHSMYGTLEKHEQTKFKALYAKKESTFHGYPLDGQVYGELDKDLTVREWLRSIALGRPLGTAKEPKDLMSPPPDLDQHAEVDAYNEDNPEDRKMKYAMGMYGLDEGGLALFEARDVGSAYGQDLSASSDILEEVLLGTAERDASFQPRKKQEGNAETDHKRPRLARRAKSKAAAAQAEQARTRGKGGTADPLGDKAKGEPGTNYLPTATQVMRMELHRRRLDWVEPDGMCMLGALSKVSGVPVATIYSRVRTQLHAPGSAASQWLTTYSTHSAADVRRVIGDLHTHWNDEAADAVLPVAALVLGVGVTVIEPDGTPLPIHGGGTILIHVTAPLDHYHATQPA